MDTVTFTAADGTVTSYFPQSYTDAAVAAVSTTPAVTLTDTGVTITHSDGSTQNFVAA